MNEDLSNSVKIYIVDVAAEARELFGEAAEAVIGTPLPEHDYRFRSTEPNGAETTYGRQYTAADVLASLEPRVARIRSHRRTTFVSRATTFVLRRR